MRQVKKYSDFRLDTQCAYCGEYPETRDHVPSKIILERPFPENLPIVPSCLKCNNGFSLDEEYFACLIECILCGTADPEKLKRERIKKILKRKPKLKSKLENACAEENGTKEFKIEKNRIENVLSKLAYGHAKYENSETVFRQPDIISFAPIGLLNDQQKTDFFSNENFQKAPEVGSRAMQNMFFHNGIPNSNWTTVQEGIYEYTVIMTLSDLKVKILIWNYLVCEIIWN